MKNNTVIVVDSNDNTNDSTNLRSEAIRRLNDSFRKSGGSGGRFTITQGINALGKTAVANIVALVMLDDNFSEENDPHGEHDFGSIDFTADFGTGETIKVWWKIDYYDEDLVSGSEDPSDPAKTTRVLTILLPSEY